MFPPHSVVPCLLFGTALSHAAQLLCPSPQDVWKAMVCLGVGGALRVTSTLK